MEQDAALNVYQDGRHIGQIVGSVLTSIDGRMVREASWVGDEGVEPPAPRSIVRLAGALDGPAYSVLTATNDRIQLIRAFRSDRSGQPT
jgi:hypothetical protein